MCVCVCVNRRVVLEWLDGEIEGVCLNSQDAEEVTQRGVGHNGASNRGGGCVLVCVCVCVCVCVWVCVCVKCK